MAFNNHMTWKAFNIKSLNILGRIWEMTIFSESLSQGKWFNILNLTIKHSYFLPPMGSLYSPYFKLLNDASVASAYFYVWTCRRVRIWTEKEINKGDFMFQVQPIVHQLDYFCSLWMGNLPITPLLYQIPPSNTLPWLLSNCNVSNNLTKLLSVVFPIRNTSK